MNAVLSLDVNLVTETVSDTKIMVEKHSVEKISSNVIMACNQEHVRHVDESKLEDVGEHQLHIKGAHKCCQCAYNSGYQQGSLLQEFISLDIDRLGDVPPNSQGRYKSIHQAFALGYKDGVNSFIKN
ncbi:hypothetical protein [Colwellia echini]|uniref:Uncharacterized protein n=1 Tax=Colwellia echini TaxID=1982103 RepID=A0ABY3MXU9_9GAMM|nr:hypothetical protein [Colwellia echini]TYK65862.1 hypothetical protein CWS31_007885 [Colwellia echini]